MERRADLLAATADVSFLSRKLLPYVAAFGSTVAGSSVTSPSIARGDKPSSVAKPRGRALVAGKYNTAAGSRAASGRSRRAASPETGKHLFSSGAVDVCGRPGEPIKRRRDAEAIRRRGRARP